MKTFYANAAEGCVLCSPDDLPEGGSWIVSDDPAWVIGWLHDTQDTKFFKVSKEVLIAVDAEFGFHS